MSTEILENHILLSTKQSLNLITISDYNFE